MFLLKRLFSALSLITIAVPTIHAGKWDGAARSVYAMAKNPEKTISVISFLIDLFLMCIPIAIVAGVVSLILKSVFDLDTENTAKAFGVIGGILLAICLLIYFLI